MTSQQGWNKTNSKVIYQPTSLPSFVTFDSFYSVLFLKLFSSSVSFERFGRKSPINRPPGIDPDSRSSVIADNKIMHKFNLRTYTQIHTPTVVRGLGGWIESPLEFLICCSISKRFYLQWKAFDLLYDLRYFLWVVALLRACDVTNIGRLLGFYQELEINFLCLTWKITRK